MLTTSPLVIAFGIATLVCIGVAILTDRARRSNVREIARLTGKVAGFTLSDLKENPAAIVHHLRSDANVCDMAGQKDMADRLRGYATLFERWFDDAERSETLRRIANGG
jgi:hypothetical protein